MVIDWAKRFCTGGQGQVYSTGRDTNVFFGATMEDAIVIKPLIGVVEHCVPPVSSIAGNVAGILRGVVPGEAILRMTMFEPTNSSAEHLKVLMV